MSFSIIGGRPSAQITVGLRAVPPITPEEIQQQARNGHSLGLPFAEKNVIEAHDRRLAVIGGGPSINDNREKIKAWEGDIWTVNGAYHWCKMHDIDSTLISTDPHEICAKWATGVKKAIVASRSHPTVFEILKENEAEVSIFSLDEGRTLHCKSSTASAAIHLGFIRGYRDITFFGCESSYPQGVTHAYMTEDRVAEMIVRCNGEEYYTAPDYLIQAVEMSEMLRTGKNGLHEESGGLLRAMVASPEYSVMWVSDGMYKTMIPVEDKKVGEAA